MITAFGGATGAAVLLRAPASAFGFVVPVLMGAASVLLLPQPLIRGRAPQPGAEASTGRLAAVFGAAVYVGYFGAAGGVDSLRAFTHPPHASHYPCYGIYEDCSSLRLIHFQGRHVGDQINRSH